MSSNGRMRDFSKFYREYARGGIHAASAAAMTAFGLLTIYHEAFAVMALLSYVVPALYVYAERRPGNEPETATEGDREPETSRPTPSTTGTPGEFVDGDDAGGGESREGDGSAGRRERDERGGTEGSEGSEGSERDEPRASPSTMPEVAGNEAGDEGGGDGEPDEASEDGEGGGDDETGEEWTSVDSPVGIDFSDVVAVGDGAYAVGEDGHVLALADGEWSTVLEDGPAAQGENLTGIDATDDGRTVWFAGDGGALGSLDARSNRHTDHSAPDGDTSTVTDIAVVGAAGEEVVVLVNGSGEVRRGEYDGERLRWDAPEKPGGGSSFSAVAFADGERGYLADTNGSVFRTTDGGETYENVGIDGAGALTAVAPVSGGATDTESFVAEDDGTVHRYEGARWTPVRPTEEGLWGMVAASERDRVVAVGEHGTVLDGDNGDWQRREVPTDETLRGVCVTTDRQIAVGDDGVVLERRRPRRPTKRSR